MSDKGPPPTLPIETYREIIDELRLIWDAFVGAEARATDVPHARFVFALTANSYSAARAATTLWDLGLWDGSLPNVRTCFESAVSAAWTQQTGHAGITATSFEQARQAANLMTAFEGAGIYVPTDLRSAIVGQRASVAPARASEARNFQAMCAELKGGTDLYLIYRHLSGQSHATSALGRYLLPTQSGGLIQVKNPAVSDGTKVMLACVVAYSLTWAARAFVEIMLNKPSKQPLRKVAQRLGIPPILTAC